MRHGRSNVAYSRRQHAISAHDHIVGAGQRGASIDTFTKLQRTATRHLRWLKDSNIVGFGVGLRRKRGISRLQHVLKIFVQKKIPCRRLGGRVPKVFVIPGQRIRVFTDVVEIGKPRPHRVGPGEAIAIKLKKDHPGTLGGIFRNKNKPTERYLLSNAHVIAADGNAPAGTRIYLATKVKLGTEEEVKLGAEIAFLTGALPLTFSENTFPNFCDAAIAQLDSEEIDTVIPGIGVPNGIRSTPLKDNELVKIYSRTSGQVKSSRIETPIASIPFYYDDSDGNARRAGLAYQVRCTSAYGNGGDSGSLVFDSNNQVVGLHVGADIQNASVFTPIWRVVGEIKDFLGIELELV